MSGEARDYLRIPIPDAALVDPDGKPSPLADLTSERAALLIFPDPLAGQPDATLRAIAEWRERMPLVDFVVVVDQPATAGGSLAPYADQVLADPHGDVRHLFGATGQTAAVLLGTDGLLAGGPSLGAESVVDLIEDMAHSFQVAYGDARRPLTAISCKCITYGRVESLEESLESFLRQDYAGDHELVIVNDYPRQRLHFDHPRVRVYNLDFTFETIGEKENFAVSACRFDTIAVWDDDDIALPRHLSNIDRYVPGHDLLHWQRGAAFNGGQIEALTSLGNSGIVYDKHLWRAVGGHPFENAGYDVTFVNRLHGRGARVITPEPPASEVSWFYSWGNGSYHMSGMGTDHDGRPNVVQRHSAHIEQMRQEGRIPTGDIELKPRWNQDYFAMLSEYCRQQDP